MAIVKIVFDTQEECLLDVLDRLHVELLEPNVAIDIPPSPDEVIVTTDDQQDVTDSDELSQEELDKVKDEMAGNDSPSVELDADGVPWDERIHSSNKDQTKAGYWQKRRSLPDGLYESVTAELKAAASADLPAGPPADDTGPAGPPADGVEWDWNTLVQTLTKARSEGKTTKAQEDEVLKGMGITLFPLLSPRTELYDEFATKLGLVHP